MTVNSSQVLTLGTPVGGPPETGLGSFRIDYIFYPGWKFIRVTHSGTVGIPGTNIIGFQMWIYGDGSGNAARLRIVDSSGQTFQPNGPVMNFVGWQLGYFSMAPNAGVGFWGGNGTIQYPLKWDTYFLVDGISEKFSTGTVYFTSPIAIYN